MMKKLFFTILTVIFIFTVSFFGTGLRAAGNHYGQIVKMEGLSSVYYVAADGKRYVFPNVKIYDSWFTDFDDVVILSEEDLTSLPLGGNVLYRPGVILIKITTDPKVYAVTAGGVLRWVTTEAIARALYGDDWNKLIDDVPDSFFTNYTVGSSIDEPGDYDPDEEAEAIDSIDANRGLSTAYAKRAQTLRCRMSGNMRDCRSGSSGESEDEDDTADDNTAPYITDINIKNNGDSGFIDQNDEIVVTFNESIDPHSVNSGLEAGSYLTSFDYGITGAVSVSDAGVVTIKNIASFDLGEVEDYGQFTVKLSLNSSAKILTIMILAGDDIEIADEDFEDAAQIGGTVKDKAGNTMADDTDIGKPDGTFGGENVNDGIEPYITSIEAENGGSDGYIDKDDKIIITFSERIDPESVHNDLVRGGSVSDIESDQTGGVRINNNGVLTIENIARFYVGDIDEGEDYIVTLALDSDGEILTITLEDGDDIELDEDDEDLDDAEQIGDTIEDRDGNEMEDDPNIDDPTGSFVSDSAGGSFYISYIKAYNYGFSGYIDEDDVVVITFSEALDPETVNNSLDTGETIGDIDTNETGGVYINSDGVFMVTDILSFDIGEVEESGSFDVELSLSSNGKVLTITLEDGDAIGISSEHFSDAMQIGGTIEDEGGTVLSTEYDIDNPTGTFGGDSTDTPPYITAIEIANGNDTDYIDIYDTITVTFNESLDPESINDELELGHYVRDVDDDDTGGVIINDNGILTISDIAEFYVGDVENDSEFEVKLALNSTGNVLTITLEDGDSVEINYEDFDDAEQIGGTIEDDDGNEMEDDPRIDDPEGSF